MKLMIKIILITAASFFVFCTENNSPSAPINSGNSQTTTGTYQLTGNQLSLQTDMQIDSQTVCVLGSPAVQYDTFPSSSSVLTVHLSSSTLQLVLMNDTMTNQGLTTAIVELYMTFNRLTGSGGIKGTWTYSGMGYTVLSGTLTTDQKTTLDDYVNGVSLSTAQIVFSDNNFIISETGLPPADVFIQGWNNVGFFGQPSDSALYDISIVRMSGYILKLTGNKNSEVVTINWDRSLDQTFSSSDSTHATYTYYTTPTSCPNNSAPDWFVPFLTANLRALVKNAAKQTLPPLDGTMFLFKLLH
jgi:hypothetical protein